eukprot:m.72178 g.72178  ORF g.72178 m.72178 type:complete len:56 (+) comp35776_c0_seq9:2289-2456(+)
MIDRGITRLQLNGTAVREPGVYIQQFPYPCYIDDSHGIELDALSDSRQAGRQAVV